MSGRTDVERAILDEEAMLEQLAGLLESGSDPAVWPDGVRAALALALEDSSMSRTVSPQACCKLRDDRGLPHETGELIASNLTALRVHLPNSVFCESRLTLHGIAMAQAQIVLDVDARCASRAARSRTVLRGLGRPLTVSIFATGFDYGRSCWRSP